VTLTNYDTDYCRYDTVDKMAGIFTKRIWQLYSWYASEVAGVTFSDSDSAPVPKF